MGFMQRLFAFEHIQRCRTKALPHCPTVKRNRDQDIAKANRRTLADAEVMHEVVCWGSKAFSKLFVGGPYERISTLFLSGMFFLQKNLA